MNKKWLTLLLALIMAGMLAFGAGCGSSATKPEVTVGEDGYVYVDGNKTDIKADTKDEETETPPETQKSAFELWKEENPSYAGTEEEWLAYLENLTHPEMNTVEYKLIENGQFRGIVTAGSATQGSDGLILSDASLRLAESVILPLGDEARWEVDITGTLCTGSADGAQLLVSQPFSEFGRVYLGVSKGSSMLYLGVRMNTVYVNYGWKLNASFFSSSHSYVIGYEKGIYHLSVDGEDKGSMTDINFNQAHDNWLEEPAEDAKALNALIRTVTAQDCIEMTDIGVKDFLCNAEISQFTIKTGIVKEHRRLLSHSLAGTRIFYLGSSITYGYASGGVAFGDIIHNITGNPYQKEAVSGTTLVDNGSDSYVQRLKKFDFAQNPDYLVVQLSTNDFSTNKSLGKVQEGMVSSEFDTSTVSGAIQYIIAYAKEQCPSVKVVFYVGAIRSSWGARAAYENYVNGDFQTICKKWSIEPLDLLHASFRSYSCFMSDDIHPTIEGYSAGWTSLFMEYFLDHI